MSQNPRPVSPLFTQVEITTGAHVGHARDVEPGLTHEHTSLLRSILSSQDRTNELLEELVNHLVGGQKQRNQELAQWKQANPELSRNCRGAAETLSKVQLEFLQALTQEIDENGDALLDGEFMLNEFVDRFGPRLAHLNGVLQVLAQLSAGPKE